MSRLASGFATLWRTSPRFLLINFTMLPIRVRETENNNAVCADYSTHFAAPSIVCRFTFDSG